MQEKRALGGVSAQHQIVIQLPCDRPEIHPPLGKHNVPVAKTAKILMGPSQMSRTTLQDQRRANKCSTRAL